MKASSGSRPASRWACTRNPEHSGLQQLRLLHTGEVVTRASGMDVHEFIKKEYSSLRPGGHNLFLAQPSDPAEHARVRAIYERACCATRTPRARSSVPRRQKHKPSSFDAMRERPANRFHRPGHHQVRQHAYESRDDHGRQARPGPPHRLPMTSAIPTTGTYATTAGARAASSAPTPPPTSAATPTTLYSPDFYFHEGSGGCALIIDPRSGWSAPGSCPSSTANGVPPPSTTPARWPGPV